MSYSRKWTHLRAIPSNQARYGVVAGGGGEIEHSSWRQRDQHVHFITEFTSDHCLDSDSKLLDKRRTRSWHYVQGMIQGSQELHKQRFSGTIIGRDCRSEKRHWLSRRETMGNMLDGVYWQGVSRWMRSNMRQMLHWYLLRYDPPAARHFLA